MSLEREKAALGEGSATIHPDVVSALPRVSQVARDAMLAMPPNRASHRELLDRVDALRLVEARAAGAAKRAWPLRIAYWNAQRFPHFDAACALIRRTAPDILLLGEIDIGMARTGQRHCLREAATALEQHYIFGTEFLELGLGDEVEQRRYTGNHNEIGFHGNGILSTLTLESPALIRLENDGDWFDGRHGERRVGGRCAVAASVAVGARKIALVSVHLESHSDPALRAEQMRRLFEAVDEFAPMQPVVVGGDLNTSTFAHRTTGQQLDREPALRADPRRLIEPERYEPLFEIARARGYAWKAANAVGPTERDPASAPAMLGHIDWLLVRGLRASEPAIIPAVDERGAMISDHEMIAATFAE